MIPYVPNLPPFHDFALAVGADISGRIPGIEAQTVKGRILLLRPTGHLPTTKAEKLVHFSGIAFRDGRLVTRETAGAFRWGAEPHDGNYTVVVADADGLTVGSDAFGIGTIYIYRAPDHRAVILSNNLHILVTICRHIGLALHADERSFLKRLYPYSLGQQPSGFTVFFEEIELLGADQYVRIREDEVIIDEKPRARHETYRDAMAAGIEAMLEQVRAVAGFSRYLIYRLSGGYDSRAVFGALVRENLLRRSWCWTFPHLEDDFEVAKLLVNYYGGEFAHEFPWHHNVKGMDITEAYHTWASQNFGLYSSNISFEGFRRITFDRKTAIVLNGGGGECFRDFYFPVPDIEERGVLEREVARRVSWRFSSRWPFSSRWRFSSRNRSIRQIAGIFAEDILTMPGDNVKEKLRFHYLNFRNRFHFGNVTISKYNRFNFSPFMQIHFMDAADILRASHGDLRRIFYDVFSAMDERLPFFPYDKKEKEFEEDIHGPDATLSKERLLEQLRDLESRYDPRAIRVPRAPLRFRGAEKRALLDGELERAIRRIRESGIYRGIDFDGYLRKLKDSRERYPDNYAQDSSSLISTANLLAYTN